MKTLLNLFAVSLLSRRAVSIRPSSSCCRCVSLQGIQPGGGKHPKHNRPRGDPERDRQLDATR